MRTPIFSMRNWSNCPHHHTCSPPPPLPTEQRGWVKLCDTFGENSYPVKQCGSCNEPTCFWLQLNHLRPCRFPSVLRLPPHALVLAAAVACGEMRIDGSHQGYNQYGPSVSKTAHLDGSGPTFSAKKCGPTPPSRRLKVAPPLHAPRPATPLSVPGSVASRSGPSTRRTSTFASSRLRPRSHLCSCPPPTRLPPHSHRHALAGTLPRCSSTLLSGASRCRSPFTI